MVGPHIFLNVTINNFRIEKEFIIYLQEVSMFRVMKGAFFAIGWLNFLNNEIKINLGFVVLNGSS